MKKVTEMTENRASGKPSRGTGKGTMRIYKAQGLSLDMSRGKPAAAQLDLSNDLFDGAG